MAAGTIRAPQDVQGEIEVECQPKRHWIALPNILAITSALGAILLSAECSLGEVSTNPISSRSAIDLPWLPQIDKAALMVVATHPDDEGIFFGGTIPYYSKVRELPTVLISMTSGEAAGNLGDDIGNRSIREKELLNASWVYGLRNQPVFGRFADGGGLNGVSWPERFDEDGNVIPQNSYDYLAEQIRQFKPDVIVTHDPQGEYGNPDHGASAFSVQEATVRAADPTAVGISGDPWQVKKVYLNRHNRDPTGVIPAPLHDAFHDWSTPEAALDGTTPLDVADIGLNQMTSQLGGFQFFIPTRHAEDWVLARSTVGPDTLVSYPQTGDVVFNEMGPLASRNNFFENIDTSGYGSTRTIVPQIIAPTSAVDVSGAAASADLPLTAQTSVDRLIDGSGLSNALTLDSLLTTTHEGFNFTEVFDNGSQATTFLTNDVGIDDPYFDIEGPTVIDFNLGGHFQLDAFYLWQYNDSLLGGAGNGMRQFSLEFSTDSGSTFTSPEFFTTDDANRGAAGTGAPFNLTTGENLQTVQSVALPSVAADVVRLTVTDNFYDEELFGGQRIGLGEVRFLGVELPTADFNSDGHVDGIDFLTWQRGFGGTSAVALATGDSNGDGDVDSADLFTWENQYGSTTQAAANYSVPEPTSVSMALLIAIATLQSSRIPGLRKRMRFFV